MAAVVLSLAGGCGSMLPHAGSAPVVLPAGAPAAALPRHGIDVLVWNVKKAERRAWRAEFEALARGKELVILQEAYVAPRMTESLAARRELEWRMGPSFAFAWREGAPTTGVAVGSAARALGQRAFVTSDTEPIAGTPKATLAVTYAIEGLAEPLLVVCMHGINFRPAAALEAQLRTIEPMVGEHRGPVILAGDLNTHHRARMEAVEAFAGRVGLRSVFDDARRGVGRRSAGDGRTRYHGWALDHVLVRGLVVEEARVVDDTRGSDHAPMIVRLSAR